MCTVGQVVPLPLPRTPGRRSVQLGRSRISQLGLEAQGGRWRGVGPAPDEQPAEQLEDAGAEGSEEPCRGAFQGGESDRRPVLCSHGKGVVYWIWWQEQFSGHDACWTQSRGWQSGLDVRDGFLPASSGFRRRCAHWEWTQSQHVWLREWMGGGECAAPTGPLSPCPCLVCRLWPHTPLLSRGQFCSVGGLWQSVKTLWVKNGTKGGGGLLANSG